MSDEYDALVTKVDAFCATAEQKAADALSCERGCTACCHVWLTVSPVEARSIQAFVGTLSDTDRAALAERGERERAREQSGEASARCPMLDASGACSIYPSRPLLCRTQGLALRYPPDTVPIETVRFRGSEGSEVVACPLNYTEREPEATETLDSDTLNTLLALVNHRRAAETGEDASRRFTLIELAAGAG